VTANNAWELFQATGAPAYYLAYRELLAAETAVKPA